MTHLFSRKHIQILSLVAFIFLVLPISAHAQEISGRIRLPLGDRIEFVKDDSGNTLLVKDYLSSTRAVVENQPSIINYSYYPYGQLTNPTLRQGSGQANSTDKLFTGHRKLDGIAEYHAGARFYSPSLGMFPQPDKVEGPHRYAYVNANPIAFIDPAGTSATSAVRRRVKTQLSNVIHKTQAYISNLMAGKSGSELTAGPDVGAQDVGGLENLTGPPTIRVRTGEAVDGYRYNLDVPELPPEGMVVRIYRGVEENRIVTEFDDIPVFDPEIAKKEWEQFLNNPSIFSEWGPIQRRLPEKVRNIFFGALNRKYTERGQILLDRARGVGSKHYAGDLQVALEYSQGGAVYYMDAPMGDLLPYYSERDLHNGRRAGREEVFELPHGFRDNYHCGVFCIGDKID